jgi:hypothetical protein
VDAHVASGWSGQEYIGVWEVIILWKDTAPSLGPMLLLEMLVVRALDDGWGFSCCHILQLLRLAPNLVQCSISGHLETLGRGAYQDVGPSKPLSADFWRT